MTTSGFSTILPQDKNDVQYNGLKNQGATCYLNAVLQCLFMTQEFRNAVESYEKAPKDCGEENLLLQLKKLFRQLSVNVATTEEITKSLGIRNVFEQQDAVEYYRKMLKVVGTQVSEVFEGKLNNITECTFCNSINKKINSFISIPLPIDSGNNKQNIVNEGLETFFKRSRLDQEDWMYCDTCVKKTETETWSEIDECPTVLTLQLKRFDFDYMQMRYVKNTCALDVPLSLNIKNNTYNLYAVINHMGGYSGGHYDALIKSYQNQKWYRFDDHTVTESEASLQGSRLPYMLMYRKEETTGFPLRILLLGPPGPEKSSVHHLMKTAGNINVVDTPNLFTLTPSKWANELKRCIKLCDPGPNVILWVAPISKFSEHQQGLFNNMKKRLGSRATKHMMVIFTNGRELKNLGQPIHEFISTRNKIKKVVRICWNRYYVIDSGNHNQVSELVKQLSKMVAENRGSYYTLQKASVKPKKCF